MTHLLTISGELGRLHQCSDWRSVWRMHGQKAPHVLLQQGCLQANAPGLVRGPAAGAEAEHSS